MRDLLQRQLSAELKKVSKLSLPPKPPSGWIKAVRNVLGMTTEQLAKKLSVVQQRVSALEAGEAHKSLRLSTLEEAAAALNCRLEYFLVPIEPLETILEKRAYEVAKKMVTHSSHSMDLEAQPISEQEKQHQIKTIAAELLAKHRNKLWDDDAL